ncbi:MAG TPA: SDR family oxidoreductase [Solirubrobacteraceae bacterium]|jgi:NAD(P)-dependent dehydrogenase (short-subunit alcohol dehydrogenase family)|nr:SDR family oxidoreductase [Solirubrobacteraceae bacterium]
MDQLGTVIVTGGASGLGAAVAERLRDDGATPVVLDRQAPADGLAFRAVDLAHPRDAEAAVRAVADERGGLDAVVAAAGTDACGDIGDVDPDEWDRVVMVNLLGTAAVARAALPYLEASGGRLVAVGSTLGIRVLPAATAYCASKFGVVGFTRALAAETAGRIGVTLLLPGGMRTRFFDGRPEQFRPAEDQALNDPRDVASAVVFALRQPPGCELRELLMAPATEPSWP